MNLAADIAATVQDGNPHQDAHGNKDVWRFVYGPSRPPGKGISSTIPPSSLLGKWREAAADPKRKDEAAKLADQVQGLLSGARPAQEKSADRKLYDALVAVESTLFTGLDPAKLGKRSGTAFGLPKERFTDANLVAPANTVVAVKLPAALFVGRDFVVDGRLEAGGDRVVAVPVVHVAARYGREVGREKPSRRRPEQPRVQAPRAGVRGLPPRLPDVRVLPRQSCRWTRW